MMLDGRIIQVAALLVMLVSFAGSGALLPRLLEQSKEATLRYTEDQIESATPEIALGRAMGALRGIVVDVLWVRATILKERGLYHEANTLAELITRLQPRFPSVWTFQGHNMAYNISVATDTEAERWEWVNKGINLVRREGLRHNPNEIELYKDLAFWFSHKIEGIADDAHIYYKTQFAREWHYVLGPPPYDYEHRIEWIKNVADAPRSFDAAVARTPKVKELVDNLRREVSPFQQMFQFDLNREFLNVYGSWAAVNRSWYATTVFRTDELLRSVAGREDDPRGLAGRLYVVFDKYASDPQYEEAWDTLLGYLRRKVLREEYNMDPQFMYELTRDIGPIDWRHASAHALYWARMGSKLGEARANNSDRRYRIVNNDRMAAHAMQDLSRYGLITFDPIASDIPGRLPDVRWIESIDRFFEHLYRKHMAMGTDGWGPDNFISWHENYLKSAVRELYTMGDIDYAQRVLDRLDSLYGMGHNPPNPYFSIPIDVFVMEERHREWDMQPHVAVTDVTNALYYAIRLGLARGDEQRYRNAKTFAHNVLQYFRFSETADFVNKFGVERVAGIIRALEQVEIDVFARILADSGVPLQERFYIYQAHTPVEIQRELYDLILPQIEQEMQRIPQLRDLMQESARRGDRLVTRFLPEPSGLAQVRERRIRERELREQQDRRAPVDR